jgi:pseudouridine-5'-monophosphatase
VPAHCEVSLASFAYRTVVMVPDAKLDRALIKNADVVLGSLQDFEPQQFGLPAY